MLWRLLVAAPGSLFNCQGDPFKGLGQNQMCRQLVVAPVLIDVLSELLIALRTTTHYTAQYTHSLLP